MEDGWTILASPSVVTPGQLYIKIFEATLLNPKETVENLYAALHLEGTQDHPWKGKTDPFPGVNNQPRWNQDFLLSVNSHELSLVVRLKKSKTFLEDETVATVFIELLHLKDNEVYDIWYPMDCAVASAKLHVLMCYIPAAIPKDRWHQPNRNFDMFQLFLERDIYYPGETVKGVVALNVRDAALDSLKVDFRVTGSETSFWTVQTGKNRTVYSQTHYFFNSRTSPSENAVFDAGTTKVWGFEFALPKNLPPSFDLPSPCEHPNSTTYAVRAGVQMKGLLKRDLKTKKLFRIRNLPPIITSKTYKQELVPVAPKDLVTPTSTPTPTPMPTPGPHPGKVYLTAKLKSDTLIAGKKSTVTVSIENSSNVETVKVLSFVIKTHIQLFAKGLGGVYQKLIKHYFLQVTVNDVVTGPNSMLTKELSFRLPSGFPPTLTPELSPLVQVRHSFIVNFNVKNNGNQRIQFPVEILAGIGSQPFPVPQIAPVEQAFTTRTYPPTTHAIPAPIVDNGHQINLLKLFDSIAALPSAAGGNVAVLPGVDTPLV